MSLKGGIYLVVDDPEVDIDQYPQLRDIQQELRNGTLPPQLLENLKYGHKKLFERPLERLRELRQKHQIRISAIGASISCHWGTRFQKYYEDLIHEVFSHDKANIHFVTEPEALVHTLMKESP